MSRRKVTRAKRVEMRQRTASTPSQTIAKCLSSSEKRICLPHLGKWGFQNNSEELRLSKYEVGK